MILRTAIRESPLKRPEGVREEEGKRRKGGREVRVTPGSESRAQAGPASMSPAEEGTCVRWNTEHTFQG